tara:strand:+ start:401 stop:610 length:210 start_codon:yes stop_codon:yes gene_type:complete
MKIPHFKKNLNVKFVEAATDFIDPPTQEILWRYGKILFQVKSEHGAISYYIEENKKKVKVSRYLIFHVN